MSKNLLTKFRAFWKELSDLERKRLWDIMSALRGEDGGCDSLKYQTTCRIRALLLGKKIGKKDIIHRRICSFSFNPTKDTEYLKSKFNSCNQRHFKGHIIDAIYALEHYVKKGQMDDLLVLPELPED